MEAVGTAISAVVARLTGSSQPSDLSKIEKPLIRMPETAGECATLHHWAVSTPIERDPPAAANQIARHLEYLAAALPARATDEETGARKAAVYTSFLQEYSNSALAHMARRACETLDWFPTPRQCLDLVAEYRNPESDQERALFLCHSFTQLSFEEWIRALTGDGPAIGNVPDQWKRIAVERGFLRFANGDFVIRAAHQG